MYAFNATILTAPTMSEMAGRYLKVYSRGFEVIRVDILTDKKLVPVRDYTTLAGCVFMFNGEYDYHGTILNVFYLTNKSNLRYFNFSRKPDNIDTVTFLEMFREPIPDGNYLDNIIDFLKV